MKGEGCLKFWRQGEVGRGVQVRRVGKFGLEEMWGCIVSDVV